MYMSGDLFQLEEQVLEHCMDTYQKVMDALYIQDAQLTLPPVV